MANSSTKDALHSITKHNNISVSGVASNEVLRFDGTNWVNSLPSSSLVVTQSSHGFSVGEALKSSGSNGAYAKAQADSAANAEVLGVVTAVADTNTFTLTVSGYITTAAAVPNETAGSALFLSAGTAGALTATEPSTAGQISKPVAIVTTANATMILVAYRGETISTGANNWDVNGSELILDADGDTSLTADTDDQIDVKISGADDFRFTANSFNVLSGSTLTVDSGATITNSGTSTGFGDAHTVASHSDTTGTGAELETLTDGSNAESLHTHTHTVVSHSDTTATGAELETLTDGSTTALHAHAGGGPSQATQAAIEAETNEDTYLPPDLVKNSPGVAKAWAKFDMRGAHSLTISYGFSGIADVATGKSDLTLSTAMSSVSYSILLQGRYNQSTDTASPTTTVIRVTFAANDNSAEDTWYCYIACFGDQ